MCCLRNAKVEELVMRRFRTAKRRGRDYIVAYKQVLNGGYPIWGDGEYRWGVNCSDSASSTTFESYDAVRPTGYHAHLRYPISVPLTEIGVKVRCRLKDLIVAGPYVSGAEPLNRHVHPQAVFRSIEILPEDNPNVPLDTFS